MPVTTHRTPLLATLALCLPLTLHAAPDAKLLAASQKAEPEVIETLKELVHIESGSANVDGIAKIADYCEKRLASLGARTERIKATRGHGTIVKGSSLAVAASASCSSPTWTRSTPPTRCRPSPGSATATSSTAPASPTTRAASR